MTAVIATVLPSLLKMGAPAIVRVRSRLMEATVVESPTGVSISVQDVSPPEELFGSFFPLLDPIEMESRGTGFLALSIADPGQGPFKEIIMVQNFQLELLEIK